VGKRWRALLLLLGASAALACNAIFGIDEVTVVDSLDGSSEDGLPEDSPPSDGGPGDSARDVTYIKVPCGDVSALQSASAWPMPGHCPTLVSLAPRPGPATLAIKWKASLPLTVRSGAIGPLIVASGPASGDLLVVATEAGQLQALTTDGRPVWQALTDTTLLGGVDPSGTIWGYESAGFGRTVSRTAPSGVLRPPFDAGLSAGGLRLAPGGGFYASAMLGNDARGFAADGGEIWRLDGGGRVGPIGGDGTVYVHGDDTAVRAVWPDGGVAWSSAPLGYGYCYGMLGPDSTLYTVSGTTVFALSPGGSVRGTVPLDGGCSDDVIGFSLGLGFALGPDGTIYVKSGPPTGAGLLTAIDPLTLTTKWTFTAGAATRSPIVAADGTIYIGSADHFLYALSPNGSVRDKVDLGGPTVGQPAIGTDGSLYVVVEADVATGATLVALGP
jgi:outer membrane protein assembly factor BamB